MLLIIFTIIVAIMSLLVALVTWLKNPGSVLHRWLFAFILSGACWVSFVDSQGLVEGQPGLWLLRLAFVAALGMGYAALHFTRVVCRTRITKQQQRVELLLFSLGVILSLSDLVIKNFTSTINIGVINLSGYLQPERGIGYPVVVVLILYALIASIVFLVRERNKARGRRRSQLGLIAGGLGVGSLVGIVTNVVLPNILHNTYPSRYAFIAIMVWTTMLIYAIVKHRFLDIRLTIVRALGYVLALLTALFTYALLIALISQFILRNNQGTEQLTYLYAYGTAIAFFTSLTFQPIRRFFDNLTRTIFYRDAYDTEAVLNKVSAALVRTTGVDSLARELLTLMAGAIKPECAAIVVVEHGEKERTIMLGRKACTITNELISLVPAGKPIVILDELDDQTSRLYHLMQDNAIAVIARLRTSKELIGYMVFGYKVSGNIYSNQDVDLIRIVTDEGAVAIQNALRFEEIARFNQTLQKEIEEATAELRESNRKLKMLDVAKDEFISMASHQLRTPLTSIKGFLSMATEEDQAHNLTKLQHMYLNEAYSSAVRMAYLIADFLNISRLQTGKFSIEPSRVRLDDIVKEEVEQLRASATPRNITIECHLPHDLPAMMIDDSKIRQVVMNFIDNAIFYSKAGDTITVDLLKTAKDIRLTVQDHGIGVPVAERHKLFAKFYRATNARRIRPDGTGVGLFIAKKVITAHGGALIFESEEGKGSTFGFTLPLSLTVKASMKDDSNKLNQQDSHQP